MSTDYLADAFGFNTIPVPLDAPCRPTEGATDKQKQTHADQWFDVHLAGQARKLCAGCPTRVKNACLAANMDDEHGVYGGTTPDERKRLRGDADAA